MNCRKPGWISILLILTAALISPLSGCNPEPEPDYPRFLPGEITLGQHSYGPCYLYLPVQPADPPRILAVIHGTPAPDQTAEQTARYYAERWAPFAEEQGWLPAWPWSLPRSERLSSTSRSARLAPPSTSCRIT